MFIAANWKMNLDKKSIKSFVEHLKIYNFSKNVQLCIFPPTIYIDFLSKLIKNIPISIGGQNCHYQSFGAFTGEISAISLKEFGCDYVILGHSERRIYNKETNDIIKKSAQFAIKSNLRPIICVGENLDQRENGKAIDFIEKQITDCLPEDFNELTIAYEPIWSIGTGKIPLQSENREMHKNIKEIVFSKSKKNVIDPESIIDAYGADSARWFMLSDSPPEKDINWTDSGIHGAWKICQKIWTIVRKNEEFLKKSAENSVPNYEGANLVFIKTIHQNLHAITQSIEKFQMNVSIARVFEIVNAISKFKINDENDKAAVKEALHILIRVIEPMVPHLAEELSLIHISEPTRPY